MKNLPAIASEYRESITPQPATRHQSCSAAERMLQSIRCKAAWYVTFAAAAKCLYASMPTWLVAGGNQDKRINDEKQEGKYMFIILGISFLLLVVCFVNDKKEEIDAWIKGTIVWCSLLFLHIEVFSCFYMLNKAAVFCFWLAVGIGAVVYIIKTGKRIRIGKIASTLYKKAVSNIFFVILFGMISVLAVVTVPYNWDSMTYHMPRVLHWVQNQSVAHYATNIVRQTASPVFHEFICTELYLLTQSRDVLFNLIQCAAFFTNAWIIFEIAKKLGCEEKYCKAGTLLFCAMPIAFGEALTTQNDNLACVFFLIYIYYLLDFLHRKEKIEDNRETCGKCICMAACVGFGYLTKPTVSMGMAFWAVVLLVFCIIRKDSVKTIIKLIFAALPVMILLMAPEMIRNIRTFGAILAPITGARQLVGTLNPKYLFVNGLKNLSFNLPTIYIPASSEILGKMIYLIAAVSGVDINHESIAEDGKEFMLRAGSDYGHDTAVNFTILLTAIVCFLWCLYRRKAVDKYQKTYTYGTVVSFVCICILIRWEPFVSRYMLPYLALMCPMVAVWAEDISKNCRSEVVKRSFMPIICWMAILDLMLLFSYHGEIVVKQGMSRPSAYFTTRGSVRDEYLNICSYLKEAETKNIGILLGEDTYEYPIQYMLKHSVERIEHVLVGNDTGKCEDPSFVPDYIIAEEIFAQEELEVGTHRYKRVVNGENMNVYEMIPGF